MKRTVLRVSFLIMIFLQGGFSQTPSFPWPEGKRMALSLSFDDARLSNPAGAALLSEYGIQATFYVVPGRVRDNLSDWEAVVEQGHEIANHSIHHSCSGNFGWPQYALEDYTMDRMQNELQQANQEIEELLGVKMVSYAYPCGQTTIGKGLKSQSFIPLISDMFLTGRLWLSEAPVDPWYCDMAALTGMEIPFFVAEPVSIITHVDKIEEKRASFRASRMEEKKEFFASRDAWSIPVNHYIGLDGALYVVDYYRRVIEHPEWMGRKLRSPVLCMTE